MDAGILAGLKVIDCATYVAGPAAATVMSDFGADVIKVERVPDGDLWRNFPSVPGYAKCDLSYSWVLTSRNKRSVALDLTRDEGRDALLRIVRSADVFVTNFQPSLLAFTAQRAELFAVLKPLASDAWSRTATVTGAGKPRERTVLPVRPVAGQP